MKDGLVLMYLKDGVIYPCGISKEQNEILQNIVTGMLGKIYVYKDKPVGEAENYKAELSK